LWLIETMAAKQALATFLLLTEASAASLCMEVPAAGDGQQVQLWGCNGLEQQQWDVTSTSGTVIVSLLEGQKRCLSLPGKDTSNGNIVEVDNCWGPTSGWRFDEGSWQIQWEKDASKCLDAGDMAEGSQIMIWDCNGMSQQKWGYDSGSNTIYLADSRRLQELDHANSTAPPVPHAIVEEGVGADSSVSNSTRQGSSEDSSRQNLRGSSASSLPQEELNSESLGCTCACAGRKCVGKNDEIFGCEYFGECSTHCCCAGISLPTFGDALC